jgi:hypothetical protein
MDWDEPRITRIKRIQFTAGAQMRRATGQNQQNANQKNIETRSAPASLGATHRAFTFYLGNPISSILKIMFILSKAS